MPNCRNCGARLSKFDADLCPVCGIKDPLRGVSSETVEITSQIEMSDLQVNHGIVRHRKTMLILFLAIGFTGTAFFYTKKALLGFIYLFASLLVMGGLFTLLFFAIKAPLAVAIIIPLFVSYLASATTGLIFYYWPNLKDGEGEFIV